eukprot:m.511114 g.511114  ORF g.511114 m.511114 type:complete len:261 (+) comp21891_c1_seq18:736-1518(+)
MQADGQVYLWKQMPHALKKQQNYTQNCGLRTSIRERSEAVKCIHAEVGLTDKNSIDAVLSRHSPDMPKTATANGRSGFCFLSIDIDSYDYWLWDALVQHVPAVVCIEFNPTIPNHIVFIQDRSESVRQGSSLAGIIDLAREKGYRLVETTLFNAFFVRADLWDVFLPHLPQLLGLDSGVQELTIDHLHQPSMATDLWQLYDGNLCIAGCKKMLWHRVPMDVSKMQVLPAGKRGKFPFAPKNTVTVSSQSTAPSVSVPKSV